MYDTETVFGADYSERTDECFSREIVMSKLKSASCFPYASLCAAVALACSLAACGGGGGSSSGTGDEAGSGARNGIGLSTDAPVSREEKPHEPSVVTPEDDTDFDATFIRVLNATGSYNFFGGDVTDPAGERYLGDDWFQRASQSCPKGTASGTDMNRVLPASISCLAGTYFGHLLDYSHLCRVTLAQDGSVFIQHKGTDRFLLRLTPDNARYSRGEGIFLGPGFHSLNLSGKEKQLRPERRASVSFGLGHGIVSGTTRGVLAVNYEDSDIGPFRSSIEGEGVSNQYTCIVYLEDRYNKS